ncbi:hypothetical protein BaRGS_00032400 [Batillaria attramentaria]|uniref:Uncharacterized protein n=1 Tax=Batillaria attramentaria TaxID=370345 RepID=A0ABD0JNP5_9CAEN
MSFRGSSGTVRSPGYSGPYPTGLDCSYTIRQGAGYVVRLDPTTFSLDNDGEECPDFVTIYDGQNTSAPVLGGPYCGNNMSSLLMSTSDTVVIRFHTDNNTIDTSRGFSIRYTGIQTACNETYLASTYRSSTFYTIRSPGYPGQYPQNLDCTSVILQRPEFTFRLEFNGFELDLENGTCDGDFLQVYDGKNASAPALGGPYCGSNKPPQLVSSHSEVTIRFKSDSYSSNTARGFYDNGTFQTPGYPDVYNNDTDHEWYITTILEGSGVELARPCGSGSLSPVKSTGNVMRIKLTSSGDNGVPRNKFKAIWTTDQDCGVVINSTNYQWYYIALNFTDFHLDEPVNGVCQDYVQMVMRNVVSSEYMSTCRHLQVYDGRTDVETPLLGERYCGKSLPPSLTSSEGMMYIRFHTDAVNRTGSTGFSVQHQRFPKKCADQRMTAPEGNFTSPAFPYQYPPTSYCVWTITVAPTDKIVLIFEEFSVGYLENGICEGAHIRLYDSDKVDVARVLNATLTIVLNSFGDSPAYANGFRASYTSVFKDDADVGQFELFPYGSGQGDKRIDLKTESSMEEVTIKAGFSFADERHTKVFIGNNGLISIGNRYPWPALPMQERVVCAYCAYIDNSDNVGEPDTDVLNTTTEKVQQLSRSSDFKATVALVVTWDRVKQGRYSTVAFRPDEEKGEATFQLALISDGRLSYVLVYYLTHKMTWTYRGHWSYVIIGVSEGNAENYQLNMYSKTKNAYTIDQVFGNTGRKGTWIYKVGEVPASPDQACQNWYYRNSLKKSERAPGFDRLPRCPCSASDVWVKTRYMWTFSRRLFSAKLWCYRLNRAHSRDFYPHGKECCYSYNTNSPSFKHLYTSLPNAGSVLAYNPIYVELRDKHVTEDRQGHEACCMKASHPKYCDQYYELRPEERNCQADVPFRFSWVFGDPHIKTLDEREYTFNGWGEYTLVTLDNPDLTFSLQGRTGPIESQDGKHANATVFTAFGAEENGTRVFVGLHPITKDALEIYGEGRDYSKDFEVQGENFTVDADNFTMFRDNNSIVVAFPSGISLTVAVEVKSLLVSVSVPLKLMNQTRGLLGNYNGLKKDEFVLPNGTVLRDNLTDREIHYLFGQQWSVHADSTVLRYPPRTGPANYSHPDFVPVFLDEVPKDDKDAAVKICGGENSACIYDYISTGSENFASATNRTGEQALKENVQIKNTLPELKVPSNVTVTPGKPTTFQAIAEDPDVDDEVTFELVDSFNGMVTVNSSSGLVTVNVRQRPVDIRLYAVDSHNGQSVVQDVTSIVCSNCSGHGKCDHAKTRDSVGTYTFQYAVCTCNAGWTGDECNIDKDACLDNPCDPYQNCTDLSPSEEASRGVGYNCSDCPVGYEKAPDADNRCLDIDECKNETLYNCEIGCDNTHGSYVCYCTSGYRLNSADKRTCIDVNECAERTDGCQQICNNTEGGYECLCYEGYELGEPDTTCVQSKAPTDACQTRNCSHGCNMNGTMADCFCPPGYDLAEDGINCVDHDECGDGNRICTQVCNNTEGGFQCSCYTGFTLNADQRTCSPCEDVAYGPNCSLTCVCSGRGVQCHRVKGCICQEGWTGSHCKNDVNECEVNPDICGDDMECNNNEGSFTCDCLSGYEKNVDGNCSDIDECAGGMACGEYEQCSNVPGSFYCDCVEGYFKDNGTCTDTDECSINEGGCQQKCINFDGSFNCECHFGYTLNTDRSTCTQTYEPCSNTTCVQGCTLSDEDREVCFCFTGYALQPDGHSCLDCPDGTWGENCVHHCECGLGTDLCDVTRGCVCKDGWTGDKCSDDIDECQIKENLDDCQQRNAECFNFRGGYRCQCRQGFHNGTSGSCQDIDECESSPCSQTCENSPGSYTCLCKTGFSPNLETGDCEVRTSCVRDDCDRENGGCAIETETCFCNAGYTLDTNNTTCQFVLKDWCQDNPCDQNCSISDDRKSFTCSCGQGYILNDDERTCRACRAGTYGAHCEFSCTCNTHNTESCDHLTGTCTCRPGWKGTNCSENVDECAQKDACGDHATCNDTIGSYICTCQAGYTKKNSGACEVCSPGTYGHGCVGKCSCTGEHVESCDRVDGTCHCQTGWTGTVCEVDVDECRQPGTHNCSAQHHEMCQNTNGSFTCICMDNYARDETGMCAPCRNGTYGTHCEFNCTCNMDNTASCDQHTGNCTCRPGWEGTTCSENVNECKQTDRCGSHAMCNDTMGSYVSCRNGTYGAHCEFNCTCNMNNTASCDPHTGNCTCRPGWEGTTCSENVNECKQTDRCGSHAMCNDTKGSYVSCRNGTYGTHCEFNCTCNMDNTVSCDQHTGNCTCRPGWEGDDCSENVNECTQTDRCGNHATFCRNGTYGAHCEFNCTCNMDNTASCDQHTGNCTCRPGWEGDDCSENVNECKQTDRCGNHATSCRNGTYGAHCEFNCTCNMDNTASCDQHTGNCTCMPGWEGDDCSKNVNECQQTDRCGNHATCNDTLGSFVCTCNAGYDKTSDGVCQACPAGTFGPGCVKKCSCPKQHLKSCDNINGTCYCQVGWSGTDCDVDVDECKQPATHNCAAQDHEVCQNTDGSFECICVDDYLRDKAGKCFRPLPAQRYGFEISVDVTVSDSIDLNDTTTPEYQSLKQQGEQQFKGEAVTSDTESRTSAANMAKAFTELQGQPLTINNQSGVTSVQKVGNVTDSQLWLIVGLVVGVPLVIVVMCIVGACCYQKRTRMRKKQEDQKNLERYSISQSTSIV